MNNENERANSEDEMTSMVVMEQFGICWRRRRKLLFGLLMLLRLLAEGNAFSSTYRRQSLTTHLSAQTKNTETNGSPNNKAAIIFLHGLGDSPDGWSKLGEWLLNYAPDLANLDITYVFPPAHSVAITVNGGEKMPGK
jgi:hypothetical protein